MLTCKTCKHWENDGNHTGTCNSDKFIYSDTSKPPKDGVVYWDYEGVSAGFSTGSDFGCIHWAKKTNQEENE